MINSSRPDVERIIRGLQDRWMQAWRERDRETLEQLLAPDFALVVSARPSQSVPRAAWLPAALSGYSCDAFEYRDMQMRDFGDFVVVSSIGVQRATAFGVDRSGEFFLTDLWRPRTDGTWQVFARYSSHPEPQTLSANALAAATASLLPAAG
jgi:ketosteroid isomerase-like protein